MAKPTVTSAKKKAWNSFSRYIRTRDCIRFTGDPDKGKCVTCNRPYDYKQLQAGHFIAGRTNSVLFDEEAVYSQCYGCNVGRGGAHVEYFIFMENEVGREKIDELRRKRHQNLKYKLFDYERIRDEYDAKYEALLASQ
jgi:hypothetical protein